MKQGSWYLEKSLNILEFFVPFSSPWISLSFWDFVKMYLKVLEFLPKRKCEQIENSPWNFSYFCILSIATLPLSLFSLKWIFLIWIKIFEDYFLWKTNVHNGEWLILTFLKSFKNFSKVLEKCLKILFTVLEKSLKLLDLTFLRSLKSPWKSLILV